MPWRGAPRGNVAPLAARARRIRVGPWTIRRARPGGGVHWEWVQIADRIKGDVASALKAGEKERV